MEFAIQKTLSADEVRLIRKKLKLKQKEMAELMNVSVKTIEYWESGRTQVKGAAASLLCILRERTWLLDELKENIRFDFAICMKISFALSLM